MVLSEYIKIKVNSRTMKRYRDLGYAFERPGDEILVKYTDLSKYSSEKITLVCDYCGDEFTRTYCDHFRCTHGDFLNDKHACSKCKALKTKEVCEMKYGVSNIFCLAEVREKAHRTIMEKYGVENASQSPEIQEKIRHNNIQKYGVASTSCLESVKAKAKETNLLRYGVEYPSQTSEFQRRIEETSMKKYGVRRPPMAEKVKEAFKHTCLERYGVENIPSLPEIREKANKTKYARGNMVSSSAQNHLCDLLAGELNFPFKRYFIDIALPSEMIAIEYNGSGHDLSVRLGQQTRYEFERNEVFRRKQLYSGGWKIITYTSKTDKLPCDAFILNTYSMAIGMLESGKHWVEIDFDALTIRNSSQTIELHESA